MVGGGEDRAVYAQVPDELFLRAERQTAGVGVEPVRADHQVEAARRAVFEGHGHAVGVLGERGDGVAEDVLGVLPGGVVQDPGQVAPEDLDVPGEHVRGQLGLPLARVVDVGHRAHARPDALEVGQDAHAAQDRQVGLAAEVDGVAAVAEREGALHDGGLKAVPMEPVGERGAGDGGAGDQYLAVRHASDFLRERSPRAHRALTALARTAEERPRSPVRGHGLKDGLHGLL